MGITSWGVIPTRSAVGRRHMLQSRKVRYNAMANNNAYFSSPDLDHLDLVDLLDLKDHQDLLVLLERLVRLERQGRNVRYSSGVNFVKLIEMKIFVLRYH